MKQFFKHHLARKMKKKNQTLSSERLEVKVGAKWKLFLIDGEKKKNIGRNKNVSRRTLSASLAALRLSQTKGSRIHENFYYKN